MRVTVVRRASAAAPAVPGVADEATPDRETSTSAPVTAYPVQRDHRRAMSSCLSSCPPAGPDEPNGWHRALPAFALRVGGVPAAPGYGTMGACATGSRGGSTA